MITRTWKTIVVVVFIVVGGVLVPDDAGAKDKKTDDKIVKAPVRVYKPNLRVDLVDEKTSAQTIGGVRVELARVPIETKPMIVTWVVPREDKLASWTGITMGSAATVWVAALPYYDVSPTNLQFHVTVTNHLGKVLRLQGVALQFTKDGETVPTESAMNDLNKVMILPEKSWEGVLQGPSLEAFGLKPSVIQRDDKPAGELGFAKEGNLLVGLYDVVTELDQASNPVTRSNFEWIYSYNASNVSEEGEALKWKDRMDPNQVKQFDNRKIPAEQFVPPQK